MADTVLKIRKLINTLLAKLMTSPEVVHLISSTGRQCVLLQPAS